MPAARSTKSPTKSPDVDAFIEKAAPFAKPILTRLRRLVHKAAALNEAGITVRRVVKKKPARAVPPAMLAAIRKNPAAKATWEGFSPSHQREYIEWITDAKQEATRERRMSQMIEQLADGKSRHWRYQ
jgi:uncharacterized protein YdeI (YjbR/CyaY-like superfamily)